MKNVLLINGPNLNLLGTREPETYGYSTLADIEAEQSQLCADNNGSLQCFQSNAEHLLIDRIHAAKIEKVDFIIINPGAFTHTSIALRDALAAVAIPFLEVHISNVHAREAFRKHSYLSDIAVGVICGLGIYGYTAAMQFAFNYLNK